MPRLFFLFVVCCFPRCWRKQLIMELNYVCSAKDVGNTVYNILDDVSSDNETVSSDTKKMSQDIERLIREEVVSDWRSDKREVCQQIEQNNQLKSTQK